MSWQRRVGVLAAMIALGLGISWLGAAESPKDRDASMKLMADGNFKDAYDGLRKLARDQGMKSMFEDGLEKAARGNKVGTSLTNI